MSETRVFLRPREIAVLLGVTRERVYSLLRDREIPSTRVGGSIRVPRGAWERWLSAKSEEALTGTKGSIH